LEYFGAKKRYFVSVHRFRV